MATRLLLGLDVGTTASKAVVFDDRGAPVSTGRAPMPWTPTATGAEITPAALLDSALDALARALDAAPAGEIAGLGVTSMGECGVLLDTAGAPVGPVIAWHDTRDEAELADLTARIDPARFARTTGLPLRHQWSLTKHRWLQTHRPETRSAVRRLDIAAWVIRSLGGDEGAEQSLASRTGWLRLDARDWWAESLDWAGASASLMPPLVTAGTALGAVDADVAPPRLAGAVLTSCGHDHQVAAVGAGAAGDGDELDSCGTAEALVRSVAPGLSPDTVGRLAESGITVGWHALAGRWCLLGGTTGGLHLQRVLAELGADPSDLDSAALAEDRTWLAALESVTAEAAAIHDAMTAVSGPHAALVVTGGWSRSTALLGVKTRRLGPLRRPRIAEAGARGAALLAGLAAGVYAGPDDFPPLPEDESRHPRVILTVTVNPSVDRTIRVDALLRGALIRSRRSWTEPSGKGVNVAIALHRHGVGVAAVAPLGGPDRRRPAPPARRDRRAGSRGRHRR